MESKHEADESIAPLLDLDKSVNNDQQPLKMDEDHTAVEPREDAPEDAELLQFENREEDIEANIVQDEGDQTFKSGSH